VTDHRQLGRCRQLRLSLDVRGMKQIRESLRGVRQAVPGRSEERAQPSPRGRPDVRRSEGLEARKLRHAGKSILARMDGLLLKRALDAAAVWHRDQRRKYPSADVPYVSHVAGVVAILSRHGFAEEVVAAGALHDVMEDCGVSYDELAKAFGGRVADLVRDVSEQDKSLSWEERKRRYIEHFATKSWEAQAISLADKIDNFQSIARCAADYGDPWAMFKRGKAEQLARFGALEAKLADLPPHPLVREYRAALGALRGV
jgi:(p)ppGpp synthase/HD superfamily hydrolase